MSDGTGSATVEAVLLTPVLVMLVMFMVVLGRLAAARAEVDGAARDAARAASIVADPADASGAAQAAAEATLAERDLTCADLEVATDTGGFVPGGAVAVTVRCRVKLSDLAPLVVGDRTIERRFEAPIDRFRAVAR